MDSKEILVQLLRLTYRLSSIQGMLREVSRLTNFSHDVQKRFLRVTDHEVETIRVGLNDIIEELRSDIEKVEILATDLNKGVS